MYQSSSLSNIFLFWFCLCFFCSLTISSLASSLVGCVTSFCCTIAKLDSSEE